MHGDNRINVERAVCTSSAPLKGVVFWMEKFRPKKSLMATFDGAQIAGVLSLPTMKHAACIDR